MKLTRYLILILASFFAINTYAANDEQKVTHSIYDVNADGSVNATDATRVIARILGTITTDSLVTSVVKIDTIHQYVYVTDTLLDPQKTLKVSILQSNLATKTVNAACYPDGSMIITQAGGKVYRVTNDGVAQEVLDLPGARDWRGVWMDSNENVYVSPHSSAGGLDVHLRGIYKLAKGDNAFRQVLSLYNPSSTVQSETETNDDCIWTFCEDESGNLYAGVYAHTVRANPSIYKSTDKGETWTKIFSFTDSGVTPTGRHIHSIIYNPYDKALYCIVGEVNQIYKSTDGGLTWNSIGVQLEDYKGSAMVAIPDGLIVGSDGAYALIMSKVYLNGEAITSKTTAKYWANTVFAIRRSPQTGWLYAFTKIDSSVGSDLYFPASGADTDSTLITTWLSTSPANGKNWQKYYDFAKDKFPEDAVHPHHCGILISKDNGETWDVLYKRYVPGIGPAGFWTTSYFSQGECLTGYLDSNKDAENPIVINENINYSDDCSLYKKLENVSIDGERTVTIEPVEGYYLSKAGTAHKTAQPCAYSKPIYVEGGTTIEFTAKGTIDLFAMISLTDAAFSSFTPQVISDSTGVKTYTYVMPNDGYIVVSYYTNTTHQLIFKK